MRVRYRTSSLLRAGGVDPDAVCTACGLDDADPVPVRRAPRWLVRTWRGPVAAMTVPWAIYVRPDVLAGDRDALARLIIHEMVHVRQWRQLGVWRFTLRYTTSYTSGRRQGLTHQQAYLAIPLECEAREIASR